MEAGVPCESCTYVNAPTVGMCGFCGARCITAGEMEKRLRESQPGKGRGDPGRTPLSNHVGPAPVLGTSRRLRTLGAGVGKRHRWGCTPCVHLVEGCRDCEQHLVVSFVV